MKIRRLTIRNVTSYRKAVEFVFDGRVNIVIGPNGGGKSNLQKTLALVISKFCIHQYDFKFDDREAKIEAVDLWTKRTLERTLTKFVGEEAEDQNIELVLVPEEADIENIRAIAHNLEAFNRELEYWEYPFTVYRPGELVDRIGAGQPLTYRIKNLELVEPDPESAEWAFKEYLRTFFIFMRLSGRVEGVRLSSPVFFFFSERSSKGSIQIQSNQITEQNYFTGFRSAYQAATGENTNLLQWGAQHFARIHWKAVTAASQRRDVVAQELFFQDPDVKFLNRYMEQLGYEWGFLTDRDSVSYGFALRRKGEADWMTPEMFSSGEREIVHFLLAMFALNVKDGVVLVDEPELHLHPRWQRIFLGLFRDIAPVRNNQFVISTHSPTFVTPETINSITRVYRNGDEGSAKVTLRDVELPEKKRLVRMVNSQNNERMFFADKVVLVEGISDRLALGSLLEGVQARYGNSQAVEILEVGGKGNLQEYRELLDAMKTPSFVVADRDYLKQVGSQGVKALFVTDEGDAWRSLREKHSVDANTGFRLLKEAVEQGNTENLKGFLEYVATRHTALAEPLTEIQRGELNRDLGRLASEGVFVLSGGEIEDYLPPGTEGLKGLIEVTSDREWVNAVENVDRRVELGRIVGAILGLSENQIDELDKELRAGVCKLRDPLMEKGA